MSWVVSRFLLSVEAEAAGASSQHVPQALQHRLLDGTVGSPRRRRAVGKLSGLRSEDTDLGSVVADHLGNVRSERCPERRVCNYSQKTSVLLDHAHGASALVAQRQVSAEDLTRAGGPT